MTAFRKASVVPGLMEPGARSALIMTASLSASATRRPSQQVARPPAENTYRLEPSVTFSSSKAHDVIRSTLEEKLRDVTYDAVECNKLATQIAEVIKQRVKELNHSRYKIVSLVAIGQTKESTMSFTSRCVWNVKFDTFAEHVYKSKNLYAVGLVYALYCE